MLSSRQRSRNFLLSSSLSSPVNRVMLRGACPAIGRLSPLHLRFSFRHNLTATTTLPCRTHALRSLATTQSHTSHQPSFSSFPSSTDNGTRGGSLLEFYRNRKQELGQQQQDTTNTIASTITGTIEQDKQQVQTPSITARHLNLDRISLREKWASWNLEEKLERFEAAANANGTVPPEVFSSFLMTDLERLSNSDPSCQRVLSYMKHVSKGNLKSYNYLLHLLGRRALVKEAIILYKKMKADGLRPNTFTFNKLINAALLHKDRVMQNSLCIDILREMRANHTAADLVSFLTMISSFGKQGNVVFAFRIYDLMLEAAAEAMFKRIQQEKGGLALIAIFLEERSSSEKGIAEGDVVVDGMELGGLFLDDPKQLEQLLKELKVGGEAVNIDLEALPEIIMSAADLQRAFEALQQQPTKKHRSAKEELKWKKQQKKLIQRFVEEETQEERTNDVNEPESTPILNAKEQRRLRKRPSPLSSSFSARKMSTLLSTLSYEEQQQQQQRRNNTDKQKSREEDGPKPSQQESSKTKRLRRQHLQPQQEVSFTPVPQPNLEDLWGQLNAAPLDQQEKRFLEELSGDAVMSHHNLLSSSLVSNDSPLHAGVFRSKEAMFRFIKQQIGINDKQQKRANESVYKRSLAHFTSSQLQGATRKMIKALVRGRELSKALQLNTFILEYFKLSPDEATYNCLLAAASYLPTLHEVMRLLREYHDRGGRPNKKLAAVLKDVCIKAKREGHRHVSYQLLSFMEEVGWVNIHHKILFPIEEQMVAMTQRLHHGVNAGDDNYEDDDKQFSSRTDTM